VDEFYIGYQPKAPHSLSRYIFKVVLATFIVAASIAAVLVIAQRPFARSTFEYDRTRDFEGTLYEFPVPHVVFAADSGDLHGSAVLVAQGKHGADVSVKGLDGHRVSFQGKLIKREEATQVEMMSGSIHDLGAKTDGNDTGLGPNAYVTISGKIVDTKCFTGVMNPGVGKVHRACAARCLHGGIPAAVTKDGALYYLLDSSGRAFSPKWLSAHADKDVTVIGRETRFHGIPAIMADSIR
jgi:hypothetical protein